MIELYVFWSKIKERHLKTSTRGTPDTGRGRNDRKLISVSFSLQFLLRHCWFHSWFKLKQWQILMAHPLKPASFPPRQFSNKLKNEKHLSMSLSWHCWKYPLGAINVISLPFLLKEDNTWKTTSNANFTLSEKLKSNVKNELYSSNFFYFRRFCLDICTLEIVYVKDSRAKNKRMQSWGKPVAQLSVGLHTIRKD